MARHDVILAEEDVYHPGYCGMAYAAWTGSKKIPHIVRVQVIRDRLYVVPQVNKHRMFLCGDNGLWYPAVECEENLNGEPVFECKPMARPYFFAEY